MREILVIENAETLGVFPDELADFIDKNENADCIIILIFNSDSKNLNSIKKSITIIKPEAQIPPWKRKAWLLELAKNENFSLAPDAAELLAESVESQEELRSEIHKLAIYSNSKGRAININDVENLSFDEGGRALLIFLDGVCAGNAADVARALKYLRNEPLLPILAAITNRLRPAMILSLFSGSYADMALKATGSDPAKKNYALNKAKNALKIFGQAKIKKFIAGAVRISFLEKTNRAEGWNGFELILWELIANNRR